MKKTLLIGAAALALAGCAAGPYYDGYGYGPSYYDNGGYGYGYGGPAYYDYGPGLGLGYYYYDGSGNRHWHDGHDNNGRGNWNADHGNWNADRGNWRGPDSTHQLQPGPMDSRPAMETGGSRSYHGEMGNEAGSGGGGGGGYSQQ